MTEAAPPVRRFLAFSLDWLVLGAWGGLLFGAVMLATGGNPPALTSPWQAQGIGLLATTIPFTLYFAFCESSAAQASLGKRILGLVVSREDGGRLSFGSALARNAIKFAPWELGHTVAHQAMYAGESGLPAWTWLLAAGAMAGPVWWIVSIVVTRRAPYDRWTWAYVAKVVP